MSRPCLLSIVYLLALAGCATTPGRASSGGSLDAHALSLLPGASSPGGAGENAVLETVSSGGALARSSFVRAVLRRNPTIDSARQAWRAAQARIRQAGALEDPMVDLGLAPLSIGSSRTPVGYEVGISQKLTWFGKRSLETSAAIAEAAASKSDLETVRRELAMTAVALYDRYFVAARSLDINAEHTELMRALQEAATAHFEAGRGSADDALQAESELARMEHDSLVLRSERDVVVAQMNELLHRVPGALLSAPPRELTLPVEREASDAHRMEESAVAGRSEIAAARARARAEQARADRASRESYPDVTLRTSYNSMWDMPEHRWMVGVGFNLPLQTGPRAAGADEANAMRAGFESEATRLEASARTEVYVSLKELDESRQVLRVFEKRLLPIARDRVEAARAGFTTSRSPFTAVVEAERNLRTTELDYQRARAECDRRHADLERAVGLIPGLGGKDESNGP